MAKRGRKVGKKHRGKGKIVISATSVTVLTLDMSSMLKEY